MGNIEENINLIAAALETIAAAQTEMLSIARWNRDRLIGMGMAKTAPAAPKAEPEKPAEPAAPKAEQPAPAAPAEPEMTYEQLKAELTSRGIEIPKGTKMTTLQKLWAQHKADPVVPAEPEKPAEPAAPETTKEPAAPADSGLFDDPPAAPAEPAKKPMTAEQARGVLTSLCANPPTVEERQMMVQALNKVGAAKFSEVPEGKFDDLVAAFKELKGVK